MKIIKKIHQAIHSPIDELITYRAMPTASIEHLDPFLFLNPPGPQECHQATGDCRLVLIQMVGLRRLLSF